MHRLFILRRHVPVLQKRGYQPDVGGHRANDERKPRLLHSSSSCCTRQVSRRFCEAARSEVICSAYIHPRCSAVSISAKTCLAATTSAVTKSPTAATSATATASTTAPTVPSITRRTVVEHGYRLDSASHLWGADYLSLLVSSSIQVVYNKLLRLTAPLLRRKTLRSV